MRWPAFSSALTHVRYASSDVASGAIGDQQSPRRAIARLQQVRRGHVVDVEQELRPEREDDAAHLGLLLHDRGHLERRFADRDRVADLHAEPLREPRVGPRFAAARDAAGDAAFRIRGIGEHHRAAQRIAGADGLHVGEHGAGIGRRAGAGRHHAVEADHRRGDEAALDARSRANAGGNGRSPEIMRSAPSSRFACVVSDVLHAIGEEADRADAADREHQRSDEHAQLARAPVAAQQPKPEQQRAHRGRPATRPCARRRRGVRRPATGGGRSARRARVVRDEHQRGAVLAVEAEHEIGHLDAGGDVEVAGRLVGHEELRLARERARDRDALLLAAGKLARIVRRALREADAVEPRACPRRRVVGAGELERQHHVLERGERGQELERLEHEAEQPLAQRGARVLVERAERLAVHVDLARGRLVEAGEQSEQRRLAGARRADDGDRGARLRRRTRRRREWSTDRRRS